VGSVGGERLPAGVVRGARRRSPLEQAFRRGGFSVERASGMVKTSRRVRGWRGASVEYCSRPAQSSPRLPPMVPVGGSGEGWEDQRVEVKGNRPFIGDREVRRGSEPPTRESPGHQVAGTGPASAGVRAQGDAADGPADAVRAAGRRVWARHAAGTGPN
jgi:hypothetical protein